MEAIPLSIENIRSQLTSQVIGQSLYYFASTGSTNAEAKRLAADGAPEGTVLVTDEQTAGRGRLGRRWNAPPYTCLLVSVLFRPRLVPSQAPRLTMLCSVAAAEAIEEGTGVPVAVKWPNDLVVRQIRGGSEAYRKLGGLLTETAISDGTMVFAVVGMGINVNVDPAALGPVMTPATSLLAELGRSVDRAALLAGILQRIEDRYPQVADDQLFYDWAERLVMVGKAVTVTWGTSQGQVNGVIEGVSPDGAIQIRDLAGNLHLISAGDVTLQEPDSRLPGSHSD